MAVCLDKMPVISTLWQLNMVTHSERHVGAGKINEQQLIGYSEQAYLSINSLLITQGSNRIKMLV